MKLLIVICLGLYSVTAPAETNVEEKIGVAGETRLALDLPFADEIRFETWDRNEVLVQVAVTISDGEEDEIFELTSRKSSDTIYVEMNKDRWQDFSWNGMCHCQETRIQFRVYFPGSMKIDAKTISGGYTLDYYGQPLRLKTISGDIDLNVTADHGVDFKATTISGEVYSDLDVDYPEGRDGLKQMVGINVRGRVFGGGPAVAMETISGDIYLRKK